MLPACFHLADDVFPRVRATAARALVAGGWSQTRTARALGVSQAMVSKYVAREEAAPDALVQRLADDLVQGLQEGDGRASDAWCGPLAAAEAGGDEALRDLLAAEAQLLAANPVGIMPQIGMNIARALPDAGDEHQILSYPGRLVEAGGRIVRPAPPTMEGGHLPRCLLAMRGGRPALHALANIRGDEAWAEAAGHAGWTVARAADTPDVDARVTQALAEHPAADAVYDPGGVGIEPCLYLAAADAQTLIRRILTLEDNA